MKTRSPPNKMQDSGEGRVTGPWTDAERESFVAGLEQFGRDYNAIATLIGTRDLSQVRNYYRAYMTRLHGEGWKSHEVSRKRKSVTGDNTVDPKKTKRSVEKSSPRSNLHVTNNPVISTPNMNTRTKRVVSSVSKESSVMSTAESHIRAKEILPPPVKVAMKGSYTTVTKPRKIDPVLMKVVSEPVMDDQIPTTSSRKERILALLRREEVQSIFSGLVGFFVVIFVKKLAG